ncbi:MAG: GntR family transcriptional regulator [Anaerolineae bacterium]|nr:GntR family transcriptional regulator [Anaerolineae bacterium]
MSQFQPDHNGPVPIYEQIKGWIQEQIVSGTWPERHKLLAEADLAAELEVSRGTIRKAIAELTKEGLLIRSHGRGTFVAPGALEQPLADRLVTFSEDLISRGIPFKTEVLEQGILTAPRRIAQQLQVAPGSELFFLKRLRLVDNSPLIMLHNYVLYAACPGIEQLDFTHVRLFEALESHYGLQIEHGRRTFQAQSADAETAAALSLAEGDPVMHLEQQTYLSDNQPIEFSDLWLRGDQFKLSATVQRTSHGKTGLAVSLLQNRQL